MLSNCMLCRLLAAGKAPHRPADDIALGRVIVRALTARGVRVELVKEQLTFTGDDSPTANSLLSVMGVFAEFERALIRDRQGMVSR